MIINNPKDLVEKIKKEIYKLSSRLWETFMRDILNLLKIAKNKDFFHW